MTPRRAGALPATLLAIARGAAAHRAGARFEGELEATLAAYRAAGVACIGRSHPPVVVGPRGRPVAFKARGGPDFLGVAHLAGRAVPVAFDAKSRAGAASFRLDLGDASDRGQLAFLADFARAGGCAGFLVHDAALERVYWLAGRPTLDALLAGEALPLRGRAPDAAPRFPALTIPALERDRARAAGRPAWPFLPLLELAAGA